MIQPCSYRFFCAFGPRGVELNREESRTTTKEEGAPKRQERTEEEIFLTKPSLIDVLGSPGHLLGNYIHLISCFLARVTRSLFSSSSSSSSLSPKASILCPLVVITPDLTPPLSQRRRRNSDSSSLCAINYSQLQANWMHFSSVPRQVQESMKRRGRLHSIILIAMKLKQSFEAIIHRHFNPLLIASHPSACDSLPVEVIKSCASGVAFRYIGDHPQSQSSDDIQHACYYKLHSSSSSSSYATPSDIQGIGNR